MGLGTTYTVKGTFELGTRPALADLLRENDLRLGDSVVDNDGKGRTLYYHECCVCGRGIMRSTLALVPVYCDEC